MGELITVSSGNHTQSEGNIQFLNVTILMQRVKMANHFIIYTSHTQRVVDVRSSVVVEALLQA
jgi:hypothetical protein